MNPEDAKIDPNAGDGVFVDLKETDEVPE